MTAERLAELLRDEANLAFHGLGLSETVDFEKSDTRDGWVRVARAIQKELLEDARAAAS